MAKLQWKTARRKAREVRAAGPIGPGVGGLVEIAKRWNASVEFVPLREDLSGFIIKEPSQDPRIYINSTETQARQRFTLAHEIGHLIERESVAGDNDYSFVDYRSSEGYDIHEFFADEFAGELLMPAGAVVRSVQRHGEFKTAVDFGVSVPALKRRLARLAKNPPRTESADE